MSGCVAHEPPKVMTAAVLGADHWALMSRMLSAKSARACSTVRKGILSRSNELAPNGQLPFCHDEP